MPTDFSNANRQPMQQLHGSQESWDNAPKPVLALGQIAIITDTGRMFIGTDNGDLEIGAGSEQAGPPKIPKEDYQIAFESRLSDQVEYIIGTSTGFFAHELWDGTVEVTDTAGSRRITIPVPSSGDFSGDASKIIRLWSATGSNDPTPSGNVTQFNMVTVGTDANIDNLTFVDSARLNLVTDSLFIKSVNSQRIVITGSLRSLQLTDVSILATNISGAFAGGLSLRNIGLAGIQIANSQFRSSYTHSTSSASNTHDVDLTGNNLGIAALTTFANQVPTFVDTAYSVGSINVTGNPGAVSFDNSILTNKGYMVVGV